MNGLLCQVCGAPGLLSYTAYRGDKPTACRHREQGATIEPDSELEMHEPLGVVVVPGEYDSDDLDRIAARSGR